MKQKVFFTSLILLIISCKINYGQTIISGTVKDETGNHVPFATIKINDTNIGAIADSVGQFELRTTENGLKTLSATAIGYVPYMQEIDLAGQDVKLNIVLISSPLELDEVYINAGVFEANNDRKVAILRPIDIYTNSSAAGDIIGAIKTLPGTQRVHEQNGLFVRGGDASESIIIIDGMTVQNPFLSTTPGVSQRSRFSPYQFKGISFSTGGYSARYGQAMSSVLDLQTIDFPEASSLDLTLNMSGVGLSGSKLWENKAVDIIGYYTNLQPYYNMSITNYDFYKPPVGGGVSGRFASKIGQNGLFKTLIEYGEYETGLITANTFIPGENMDFRLKNNNTYINSSYAHSWNRLHIISALSYSGNLDNSNWGTLMDKKDEEWRAQGRTEMMYDVSDKLLLIGGGEFQYYSVTQDRGATHQSFIESQPALYIEGEYKPDKKFGIKPGFRFHKSNFLNKQVVEPRLAFAYKTGKYSQVSMAGGLFHQNPDKKYLLRQYKTDFQKATHYMFNYQIIKNGITFRGEVYYKDYSRLVRELIVDPNYKKPYTFLNDKYDPNPYRIIVGEVDNNGEGYARGIDIFFRDYVTIKNLDYWVSYGFIDTKRRYQNYTAMATPDFISDHNLNILLKYYLESYQVLFNSSYSYASGRHYFSPDTDFMKALTPDSHDVSFTISYLMIQKNWYGVFYLTMENVFNFDNITGYRYGYNNARFAIKPPVGRSVFIGLNISLSQFTIKDL